MIACATASVTTSASVTLRLAFFRPASALTHLIDFVAWPRAPLLMHLHSLVWFALALVAVCLVYRRLIAPSPELFDRAATLFRELYGQPSGTVDRLGRVNDLLIALTACLVTG